MPNDIKEYKPSAVEYFSSNVQNQLQSFYGETGLKITDKVRQRIVNGAREAYMVLLNEGLKPADLDKNNIFEVFEQVAFLPVNPNAYPKQAYFSTRNIGNGKKKLEYNVQGDGWETMLRIYGENLIRFRSVIIREGDLFSGIEYEGFEQKAPKIKLLTNQEIKDKGLDKKIRRVENIVYMIETTYGIEYHVITREDVKANILAQALNNGASPELIREMSEQSVDDILDPKGKWLDMKIKKKGYNNTTYEANILSPTYRNESSREGMIITKMKKYLCNKFPKDFDKDPDNKEQGAILQRIYQQTLQEDNYNDDNDFDNKTVEEVIEVADAQYEEKANKEDLGEKLETRQEEEIVDDYREVEEEENNDTDNETTEPLDIQEEQEPQKEVEVKKEPKKEVEEDTPEWMR